MHRRSDQFFVSLRLATVCLLLAACSPNNDDQESTETAAEAPEISAENVIRRTVPFITVRNKTGSVTPSKHFGNERGSVHTGYCDITWTPIPIPMLEPIATNMPFYIPHGTMRLESVFEVDEPGFWRKHATDAVKDHPLLYVHGYNIGFEKGCSRAALFQENLCLGPRFLLFSWPSDDAVMNYAHDEADIYWSVAYIEQTLERMISSFGAGSIDIFAHSLGTRGVLLALVRLSRHHNGDQPLLHHLVLAAADVDAGIFKQYLDLIRPLARNITLYVSDNDNALAISQEFHGYPRMGRSGPHIQGLEGG